MELFTVEDERVHRIASRFASQACDRKLYDIAEHLAATGDTPSVPGDRGLPTGASALASLKARR